MKRIVQAFILRGLVGCCFGPLVLAVLYLILERQGIVQTLTAHQVSLGIFSLSALAFIVGGMNAIYQLEQLPLMAAISIHGAVLYASYLATYLLNGWLQWGAMPILVFSGIFILLYLGIWAAIYAVIKRNTKKVNETLKQKQQQAEDR